MPPQDRGRGNRKDLRPLAAAHQPRQRSKPDPVSVIPAQPSAQLTAQHLVLVAQHQQLGVLGQVRPDQHRQQAEQAPQQAVDERQQHPRDSPSHATDPAAAPQLTVRDRVSERDRVLLAAVPADDTLSAYSRAVVDQAIRAHGSFPHAQGGRP